MMLARLGRVPGVFLLGLEQRRQPCSVLLSQMTGQLFDRDALKKQR